MSRSWERVVRTTETQNGSGQRERVTSVVETWPSTARPASRGSITRERQPGESFNFDLYDNIEGLEGEDVMETDNNNEPVPTFAGASTTPQPPPSGSFDPSDVITCYRPEPAVYVTDYEPAIDRTPPYERGPLKVRNASLRTPESRNTRAATGSTPRTNSSISPFALPPPNQSPPVWFNRESRVPTGGARPLPPPPFFIPDPRDDVFAPTADQRQPQSFPSAFPQGEPDDDRDLSFRRREDRGTPTKNTSRGRGTRASLGGLFGFDRVDKSNEADKQRLRQMRAFQKPGRVVARGTTPPTGDQTSPRRSPRERKKPERFADAVVGGINKFVKKVTKGKKKDGKK
ncbi:uncharacterized protein RCC_08787 [Ramularia collo-cygni]|uniref:Uncharacterized protein n=1 Tax=Ramularia collo-cygni TaxID=112498 RepID=A0A2D3UYC8_9PEZI|nr:uncharacterized protein RCC_08787 [Ramularia collo-cygni]CZT23077.1 uncharacterized protein RCC_08787 [Ramularia collo-cygni]